ncbi:MAG: ArsA family ATPase, partial [Actinomycetota bacterium]|nr:ArsA family ATPase [Actinomycetota bacterium]
PEQQAAAAVLRLHADRIDVARRERKTIAAALHGLDPHSLTEVPLLRGDVHDIDDLTAVGAHLYGRGA